MTLSAWVFVMSTYYIFVSEVILWFSQALLFCNNFNVTSSVVTPWLAPGLALVSPWFGSGFAVWHERPKTDVAAYALLVYFIMIIKF
jgi:hypothetical protein